MLPLLVEHLLDSQDRVLDVGLSGS
jgi:hypothetical protein